MPRFFITPSDLLEIDRIIHRGAVLRSYGTDRQFHWQSRCRRLIHYYDQGYDHSFTTRLVHELVREEGGEGIEYFVVLLTMLLVVVIRGSGALSADRLL